MRNIPIILMTAVLMVLAACSSGGSPDLSVLATGVGPRLSTGPDGSVILSYIETGETTDALVFHDITATGIGEKRTVASGDNWFVNWADFPSVVALSESNRAAHWLVRQPAGGYAYDIFAAFSSDAGATWGEPFRLHDDDTPTEHGFVTLYPDDGGLGAVWLDGRHMTGEHGGDGHGSGGMTLRGGSFELDGSARPQQLIDDLTCDCCQTDITIADSGPIAVYRDRSDEEVRDIYVSRFVDGKWLPGQAVHSDDWSIAGCPVNGPVVDSIGDAVSLTWFTVTGGSALVNSAWSLDAGKTFSTPITIDDNAPLGYVGSTIIDDNAIVASWVCRQADKVKTLCYRRVGIDGTLGPIRYLESTGLAARLTVPQVAVLHDDLLFAWTQRQDDQYQVVTTRVSVATLDE